MTSPFTVSRIYLQVSQKVHTRERGGERERERGGEREVERKCSGGGVDLPTSVPGSAHKRERRSEKM